MISEILNRLVLGRRNAVMAAVDKPNTDKRPSYMYGYVVGMNHGWQAAIDEIKRMMAEDEEREKGL